MGTGAGHAPNWASSERNESAPFYMSFISFMQGSFGVQGASLEPSDVQLVAACTTMCTGQSCENYGKTYISLLRLKYLQTEVVCLVHWRAVEALMLGAASRKPSLIACCLTVYMTRRRSLTSFFGYFWPGCTQNVLFLACGQLNRPPDNSNGSSARNNKSWFYGAQNRSNWWR